MAVSCLKEDMFSIQGYQDFATAYQGKLVTDNGLSLTIVKNESGNENWKNEGERFLILCDILNRNLETTLKGVQDVDIVHPVPYTESEDEPDDPVDVFNHSISGGYINMVLEYYTNPTSNTAHVLSFYYETNAAKDEFTFHVLHEGNDENPAFMDEKKLEKVSEVVSVPIWDLLKRSTPTKLNLCLYQLKKAQDGTYSIEQNTYPLHTGSVVL